MDHYRFIRHGEIPPVLVAGPLVHVGVPGAVRRADLAQGRHYQRVLRDGKQRIRDSPTARPSSAQTV